MFIKYIGSCVFIIAMGIFLYMQGGKKKQELNQVSGVLTYLNKTYRDLPNRDFEKYRYLRISGTPETFELFIGKESGDFKPDLEKIDDLKIGDRLTVYCSDGINNEDDGVQRLVQFIDRGNEPVYKKGSWVKMMGSIIAGAGVLILVAVIIFKRLGKI